MKTTFGILLLLIFFIFFINCPVSLPDEGYQLLNFEHLNHLSEDVNIKGRQMTLVRIYSEHPDYRIVEAKDEGIACVDDVARAAVLYSRQFKRSKNQSDLMKSKHLLDFIINMQAPNGLFYNFIFSDLTINRTHKNSIARADWWSWRAIWAFAEAIEIFQESHRDYASSLIEKIELIFPHIDSLLQTYPATEKKNGIKMPTWLPYKSAADQASIMLLALVPYYNITKNQKVRTFIEKLCEGILQMQMGDSLSAPHGCFLSYQNRWHAYGNCQSYALLMAGEALGNKKFLKGALLEIDNFHNFLTDNHYLNAFKVKRIDEGFELISKEQFSQISYGIRPMVWACLKAHEITGRDKYAQQAAGIACWLFGKNVTGKSLYDTRTGRCFDGINDANSINLNSGAESTIEALFMLQAIEGNPISKAILWDFIQASK